MRLDQVATVLDSIEDTHNAAWFYTHEGGRRTINMSIQRQPGTNIIEVIDAVRALMPALEAQLPPSAHVQVRQDRSKAIRKAFADIQWTMLVTLATVVLMRPPTIATHVDPPADAGDPWSSSPTRARECSTFATSRR